MKLNGALFLSETHHSNGTAFAVAKEGKTTFEIGMISEEKYALRIFVATTNAVDKDNLTYGQIVNYITENFGDYLLATFLPATYDRYNGRLEEITQPKSDREYR
jgi:hypothetical protein